LDLAYILDLHCYFGPWCGHGPITERQASVFNHHLIRPCKRQPKCNGQEPWTPDIPHPYLIHILNFSVGRSSERYI
jgi:hypothetical protein